MAPKLRTWASLQRKGDRIPDPECSWDESDMQLGICSWDFWGRGWKVVGALGREKPSSDTLLAGQRDSMSKSRPSYGRPRWDLRLSRPGGSGLEVARSLRPRDPAAPGSGRMSSAGCPRAFPEEAGVWTRELGGARVLTCDPASVTICQASGADGHPSPCGWTAGTGPGPPRAASPRHLAWDGTDPRSARQAAAVGPLGLRNRGASPSDVSASCRFGGP